uniref:Type I polyketide synthase ketoyl reductase domain protein n=1 Tax=Gambierdiscus excentricus TaxID=986170 RepID=A0A1S6K824_9DINO|nr:type I polyketide synthase ketoyl reductase domain protein [Gambierdiscus excentricus]
MLARPGCRSCLRGAKNLLWKLFAVRTFESGAEMSWCDESLSMIGEQDPQKMMRAYERLMHDCTEQMSGHMCWPVDWFPEHLNVESATGNSIHFQLEAMANPLGTVSQWPPVDQSEPKREAVLVFSDSYGFCKEIIEQAPPGRIGVSNVQTKPAERYSKADVEGLMKMHRWDLVIFASGIDPPVQTTVAHVLRQQDAVLLLYLRILKCIGNDASCCRRLCVMTADVFAEERQVHEECGLGLIANSTLFGMSNTARLEVPCPVQYIDAEWALESENTKGLVSEIFRNQSFGHNTVRMLNRGRYVLRQVPSAPYENMPNFEAPSRGIIGISGGNGGVGLVFGLWLLHKARQQENKKFVIKFLSRSMRISSRNMANWKEVERMADELDITVEQVRCDCSKQEAVNEFVSAVSPHLAGFVHSAGVLQDSMLINQTWEKFDTVLEAKSRAALFLHDALERMENPGLEFFWMFSAGAVYGNMGQLNYSAANAFLDGLARHRRALGRPAVAPQWGAWGDVGMAAEMDEAGRRRMANSPMPYFSSAEGLYGFECLLRSGLAYGWVFKFNPPLMFGMVQPDDTALQCYARNFTSYIVPPPPGDPHKNPYTTIAYETRRACHRLPSGLVFSHLWPDKAEKMQDEEAAGE